jgi:hypothetical protein
MFVSSLALGELLIGVIRLDLLANVVEKPEGIFTSFEEGIQVSLEGVFLLISIHGVLEKWRPTYTGGGDADMVGRTR